MSDPTTINYSIPLKGNHFQRKEYNLFKRRAKNLKIPATKRKGEKRFVPLLKTNEEIIIVANYSYLIYEYFELYSYRTGTNYTQVRNFAKKYRTWLEYIFNDKPILTDKVYLWTKEKIDMTEIPMYAGTTNRYNKNTYH